ncbi:hypothetical protein EU537_03895 [Candidatus Thorarchaeota archaeon]|nr:MAG: hypothetical protein EU537_03895 [Candidatus Thorarchaeota archaeon]
MSIRFYSSGVQLLLNKAKKVKTGRKLTSKEINEILENSDIAAWLSAYDSWIEDVHKTFRRILKSLHKKSPHNLNEWAERIDFGLRVALEDTKRLQKSVELLRQFDWMGVGESVVEFLPPETKIQAQVFATIDGFNGGMYREDKIFLSLVLLDATSLEPGFFRHEFHHNGFDYWWKKHPLVKKYSEEENSHEKWFLDTFAYLASEGLANAFCSPSAISKVDGHSERIRLHNSIIEEYEQNWNDLFERLINLLHSIINGEVEDIVDCYEDFALDMKGEGHPIGHFVSGRMVQRMDTCIDVPRQDIIDLCKNPFKFLKIYNTAAQGDKFQPIPPDIITSLDSMLKKMRQEL